MGRSTRLKAVAAASGVAAVFVLFGLAGWTWLSTAPLPARLSAADSTVVEYRDGSVAHVFLSADDRWRLATPLVDVDPAYIEALLAFEDKRFWSHPGVDPLALARAVWQNVSTGRRVSGASTITMQLARLLEPRPRTWRSKAIEAVRALQLERQLTKREILLAYLRFAPYGRNIEGIEAASRAYFGHGADTLSAEEVATLLAVPQNPRQRHPSASNGPRLLNARDSILARLHERGVLPVGTTTGPVPTSLKPLPRAIPHFAVWVRRQQPGKTRIRTSIDRGIQRSAEQIVAGHAPRSLDAGIHGVAAVVVDTESGELRAAVGNFDFGADYAGAQIPGFAVPRSTGSLLKPFIFARAIDRGLAHPSMLISDTPLVAGSYRPENYDGDFDGLVSLGDALSRSLNVPFIRLLGHVGVESLLEDLRSMGVTHLSEQPAHYGLAAAVGGVEITPLEVAGLYATLARGGVFRELRMVESQAPAAPVRVFSRGATWLTREVLARKDRPDFPERNRMNPLPRGIHWKTGTSYGHLDAWAAGSDRQRTIVVWSGNFDRTPSAALVGSAQSGPILFDLLEALPSEAEDDPPPHDLAAVDVCSFSGHLPSDACPHKRSALLPRRSVPTERCPYHVHIDVDDTTGHALTAACRGEREYSQRSYLVWPSEVQRHLTSQLRSLPKPPAYARGCLPPRTGEPPAIVSPPPGRTLVLMPGIEPSFQQVPFEADVSGRTAELSWFVDGRFLGTTQPADRVWWTPSVGVHDIVVMDETGAASRRQLRVRGRHR